MKANHALNVNRTSLCLVSAEVELQKQKRKPRLLLKCLQKYFVQDVMFMFVYCQQGILKSA